MWGVHRHQMTEGLYLLLALGTLAVLIPTGYLPAAETATVTDAPPEPSAAPAPRAEVGGLGALWVDTARFLGPTADRSRALLLGRRNPNGASCIPDGRTTNLLATPLGGVGTRTCALLGHAGANRASARGEYLWQQSTLKSYCEDLLRRNHEVYAKALRLAEQAQQLSAGLAEAPVFPADLRPAGFDDGRTLLGATARRLDEAVAGRDLAGSRCGAGEFHAAAAALADLHRWVDLLLRNELSALAFQKRCKDLYLTSDRTFDLDNVVSDIGLACFPGAFNAVCLVYNLTEVEHQAEWLFAEPSAAWQSAGNTPATAPVPAAVRMPPHLRKAFVTLRGRLSAPNQRLWDDAATEPYHHTYLANVLARYQAAGVLDDVGEVLERFDRVPTDPTMASLMDVLFYRGGSPDSSGDPAERFDPRLMQASLTLAGSPEQALLGAQHFARAVFGSWANYSGGSHSLTQALDAGRFDCIDVSNLIGILYRNAGRGGVYAVRWCAGEAGHSQAAAVIDHDSKSVIGIVDGLDPPQTAADLWPEAYARGHAWPEGYVGARAPIYAVEVLARGLDTFLWCQGLVVRGEHAGTLVRHKVPYLPQWTPSVYAHSHPEPPDAPPSVRTRPVHGG